MRDLTFGSTVSFSSSSLHSACLLASVLARACANSGIAFTNGSIRYRFDILADRRRHTPSRPGKCGSFIRFDCSRLHICLNRLFALIHKFLRTVASMGAKIACLSWEDVVRALCISYVVLKSFFEIVLAFRESTIIASNKWERNCFGSARCSDSSALHGHDRDLRHTFLPIPGAPVSQHEREIRVHTVTDRLRIVSQICL